MAGERLVVNVGGIRDIARRFDSPKVKKALADLPRSKAIAALVAQSIADNFAKEGPGWTPLKGKTLRLSVAEGILKQAQRLAAYDMAATKKSRARAGYSINPAKLEGRRAEFNERVEKYLLRGERQARKAGAEPGRMILQRTGLLKKVATTPGATATSKTGVRGSNTYRVEGTNLIWGVNLVYAKTHNRGDDARGIPARPFLVIRDEWYEKIKAYMVERVLRIIEDSLARGE